MIKLHSTSEPLSTPELKGTHFTHLEAYRDMNCVSLACHRLILPRTEAVPQGANYLESISNADFFVLEEKYQFQLWLILVFLLLIAKQACRNEKANDKVM